MLPSGFEDPTSPVCRHCSRGLVEGTRFCPHCGLTQGRQSFRGPIVLGVVALLLVLLGGGGAAAAFTTLSSDGFSGVLADWAGPTLNEVLSSTGSAQVELIDGASGASTTAVIAFIGGILVSLIGALLLCVAVVWAIVRTQLPRRGGAAYARAVPAMTSGRDRAAAHVERARPHVERAVHRTRTEVVETVERRRRRRP